jgi:hypothetical protein
MQKVSVGTDGATWEDVATELRVNRQPPPAGHVLAAGCMISVMALLYTTIGFVIGYVIRGL